MADPTERSTATLRTSRGETTLHSGGLINHMTQVFGDPDPEIVAQRRRARRRAEFRARVRTVQEVAITVAIIVLAVLAAAVLLRLYGVIGEVWT
jgi:hypothetical protein